MNLFAPLPLRSCYFLLNNPWLGGPMLARTTLIAMLLTGFGFATPAPAQAACEDDPYATSGLNAVLYDQRSVEHALIAEQTFKAAIAALKTAKSMPGDALMPDSVPPPPGRRLPDAVILDIDETVLDNSPAQAYFVKNQSRYCDPDWNRWLASRAATAIPGAVAFTQAAAQANVQVFYVTNRTCKADDTGPCPAKADTMAVMARLGFARADDPAAFLLQNEKPDWTSDKSSRRALIATTHRVVMMLGDQLTDFVSPATARKIWDELTTPIVSAAVAALPPSGGAYRQYQAMVGTRWFVVPNAQYGFFLDRFKNPADRLAAAQAAAIGPPPSPGPILATWNAEWFMAPDEFDRVAARGCRDGEANPVARSLPCNVASGPKNKRRSAADIAAQARYARKLDADVIALQEVDGPEAAKLLFPSGYQFCFTHRVATNPDGTSEAPVQDVGFAVRDRVAFECKEPWREIGLPDNSVRWAARITVNPGTPAAFDMVAVHLKSGCSRDPLTSSKEACRKLRQQTALLHDWLESRPNDAAPFILLGDFNRELDFTPPADGTTRMWPNLDTPNGGERDLTAVSERLAYQPCDGNDHFTGYIDQIVVSASLAPRLGTAAHVVHDPDDVAAGLKTSDHCAVRVELKNQ